ncbi:MAG: acetyl-CoA carboxylase biotin carboxyl carrier protein [Planctomycetota bacterium]
MANKKDTDLQKIKELIEIMKENELVELEIKHDEDKIFLKRSQPQPPALTAVPPVGPGIQAVPAANTVAPQNSMLQPESVARPQPEDELTEIKSPIVGTFYTAPSPDSEPYIEVGSQVNPQAVVCIVEAMKVMNEIKAEVSGTVTEILVKNGQAVEYGQVLFKVRPD